MSDMADALAHSHRSEEAIELLKNAMRLNPFYPDQYLWHLGGAYFNLKRYDEAIQTIHGMQNPTEGRRLLAASYGQLGTPGGSKGGSGQGAGRRIRTSASTVGRRAARQAADTRSISSRACARRGFRLARMTMGP